MKYCIAHLSGAVALLFFMLSTTNAQSYHQLTMNDFEGIPRTKNGSIIAYTNCSIDFRYMANKEKNYYRLDFNIQLTLNHNKSWMDKQKISSAEMLSEILKHEQGHYLIAYLEQQELLRAVSQTVFYADYQYQAHFIFNQVDAKYKQLNLDYDQDTQHMTNRGQQQSWDVYFKKRLEFMPPE